MATARRAPPLRASTLAVASHISRRSRRTNWRHRPNDCSDEPTHAPILRWEAHANGFVTTVTTAVDAFKTTNAPCSRFLHRDQTTGFINPRGTDFRFAESKEFMLVRVSVGAGSMLQQEAPCGTHREKESVRWTTR